MDNKNQPKYCNPKNNIYLENKNNINEINSKILERPKIIINRDRDKIVSKD